MYYCGCQSLHSVRDIPLAVLHISYVYVGSSSGDLVGHTTTAGFFFFLRGGEGEEQENISTKREKRTERKRGLLPFSALSRGPLPCTTS